MALTSSGLAVFETLRSTAFGSITNSYVGVGVSFVNPIRMFTLVNTTTANLLVSFNGIDDHMVVPAEVARVIDISSNRSEQAGMLETASGTRVYVKYETGAPVSGTFYVEAMYASQNAGGR